MIAVGRRTFLAASILWRKSRITPNIRARIIKLVGLKTDQNIFDRKKNKLSCVIICLLSLICIIDSYYYGVRTHGEGGTWIYNNIQYIALCAHAVFISSFINIARIIDDTRCIIGFTVNITVGSDYLMVIDYNKSILQKALAKK